MTRIQLDTGYIELREDVNFPITLAFADIKENGARSGGFSKVLEVEGSANNENIIGKYFDVDLSNDNFDRNKKTTCTVIQNGTEIFTGFIQLVEVARINAVRGTNQKAVNYKIAVFDEVANFFLAMGDKELTELDFSDYGHVFNRANIIASWDNTEGYIYPQFAKDDNVYTLRDFKPAIFELDYIKRIFASNGYTFTFDQATDNDIRLHKRIIPFNGKNKDEDIGNFLKQKFTVIGEDEALSFTITESNIATYPSGWLPMYDYLLGSAVRGYTTAINSKAILNNIFADAQNQYNAVTNNIVNLAGNGRTWTFLTSYDYSVNVRGQQGGTPITWEVIFTSAGASRCDVNLSLVIQSLTDANKRLIIDSGTAVETYNAGTTYTYGSSFELLGSGSNASIGSLGLFDASEEFDINAIITARYFDANGNLIPNSGGFSTVNSLTTNDLTIQVPCRFLDIAGDNDPVRLEFEIEISNLQFQAVPDIEELVQGANIDPTSFIPKKIKQRDLISSVFKSYNLVASPDPNDETNIILKTRDRYYDDGEEWDWSRKLDEQQNNTITFLSNSVKREQRYRYKADKDIINQTYQDEFNLTYGETQIRLDNEYTTSEDVKELIYSPTPTVQGGITILPSINGAVPENNIRVLLNNGTRNVTAYPFYDDVLPNANTLAMIGECLDTSMFDNDVQPSFSILFDSPKALFHGFQTGQTSNYLYNLHHKRELTTINLGKMLTGYFDLTERDFQKLSKRLDWKIFIKDNGWFYISKVHNYNGVVRTLTKVDLVTADDNTQMKFKQPILPVAPSKATEATKTYLQQINSDTNILIGNFANYVSGKYNLVVGKNVNISGNNNKVLSDNVTLIGSNNNVPTGMSGSKVLGDNQTITKLGTYVQGDNVAKAVFKAGDVNQVGVLAPTLVEQSDSIGLTSFIRFSAGVYELIFATDVFLNKTLNCMISNAETDIITTISKRSDNVVRITTSDLSGVLVDDKLTHGSINIEVY